MASQYHSLQIYQISSRVLTCYCSLALQKLRLTCRKFSVIVTPFLFENMTLDEKFQERHQLTRIIEFATQCPALAACVRRLQLKMAPVIRRPLKLEYPSKAESSVKWVCIQPRNTSRKKKKGEPPPNSSLLKQLKTWVVNPRARYEDWMEERPVDFMVRRLNRPSSHTISKGP